MSDVCGEKKSESVSEKLLGIVVNNSATFKDHIHGDGENQGLLKQLASRVGMLKKVKRFLAPAKLRMVMDGVGQGVEHTGQYGRRDQEPKPNQG